MTSCLTQRTKEALAVKKTGGRQIGSATRQFAEESYISKGVFAYQEDDYSRNIYEFYSENIWNT